MCEPVDLNYFLGCSLSTVVSGHLRGHDGGWVVTVPDALANAMIYHGNLS